jgi:restriction endonuclease
MAPSKKNATSTAPRADVEMPPPTAVDAAAVDADAVAVPVAEVQSAPPAVVVDEMGARIQSTIDRVQGLLNTLPGALKEFVSDLKALQKEWVKQQKQSQKGGKRKRRAVATAADGSALPKQLSGFNKPTLLSNEMCEFLGLAPDSMLARTDVTRQLNKYIVDNKLQHPVDKRTICPDAKLLAVLDVKEGQDVTYFTLQSLIKHHFKPQKAPATSTEVSTASA